MQKAGIDTTLFKTHSTQAASNLDTSKSNLLQAFNYWMHLSISKSTSGQIS